MSKAYKITIALTVLVLAGALLVIAVNIRLGYHWLNNALGIISCLICCGSAIYIKGFFPGDRWPKNYNNKDWE